MHPDLENLTPEELFGMYTELDAQGKTCDAKEWEQVTSDRSRVAESTLAAHDKSNWWKRLRLT